MLRIVSPSRIDFIKWITNKARKDNETSCSCLPPMKCWRRSFYGRSVLLNTDSPKEIGVTKGRISKIVAGLGSFRRLSIDHPFHIQQVMGQEHTQAQQPILNPYLQSGPNQSEGFKSEGRATSQRRKALRVYGHTRRGQKDSRLVTTFLLEGECGGYYSHHLHQGTLFGLLRGSLC